MESRSRHQLLLGAQYRLWTTLSKQWKSLHVERTRQKFPPSLQWQLKPVAFQLRHTWFHDIVLSSGTDRRGDGSLGTWLRSCGHLAKTWPGYISHTLSSLSMALDDRTFRQIVIPERTTDRLRWFRALHHYLVCRKPPTRFADHPFIAVLQWVLNCISAEEINHHFASSHGNLIATK